MGLALLALVVLTAWAVLSALAIGAVRLGALIVDSWHD